MDDYKINSSWTLWNHNIFNDNWDIESYNNLFTINNLYDLKYLIEHMNDRYIIDNMLFLMRENILPIWEDKHNSNGSICSFKVYNKDRYNQLILLIKNCIIESLHINPINYDNINGISITPKKNFSILKIWFKTKNNINTINQYKPYIIHKNCHIK